LAAELAVSLQALGSEAEIVVQVERPQPHDILKAGQLLAFQVALREIQGEQYTALPIKRLATALLPPSYRLATLATIGNQAVAAPHYL